MSETIFGRCASVAVYLPTPAAGNYSDVIGNILTVNNSNDPTTPGNRIVFRVTKTDQKEPNTAEIGIYNLSSDTRSKLEGKGVKLALSAGYQGSGINRIFAGDVRFVNHDRQGANWVSKLTVADGERSFQFARANISFAAGSPALIVVQQIVQLMGLPLANLSQIQGPLTSLTLSQGYTASGRASKALDRFLRAIGWRYSIQNGAVQILAPGQSITASRPLISPTTGLIGSPQMGSPEMLTKPALCKFRSFLIPAVPEQIVQLQAERFPNPTNFKVRKALDEGDTDGGPWYTTIWGQLATGS